jgi:protein SCO1/2
MKLFRTILWALVGVFAVALGWVTYELTRGDNSASAEAYGVDFALVDENGEPITEEAFRGQPTAVFFGFTHCPDVCPTTLYELGGWMDEVDPEGDSIDAYMVTVDPERDTPEILGSYLSNVSERIGGITGEPAEVAEMVKGFNIYSKKVPLEDGDYTMDHSASVILLDAKGRFEGTIAYGENPETAVQKLRNLIES